MPELHAIARAASVVLTVACAARTTVSSQAPTARGPGADSAAITVASFNFPESVLLAYLYADVLAGKGHPVGRGSFEAALTAGLAGTGMSSGLAVSAVLLFRLATYWLPVAPGWVSLRLLPRWDYA